MLRVYACIVGWQAITGGTLSAYGKEVYWCEWQGKKDYMVKGLGGPVAGKMPARGKRI